MANFVPMTHTNGTATKLPRTLTPRIWVAVILLGLVGQLAWVVENMYLNVFIYDTITTDPRVTATLVASSAIAATIATMFIGVLSDKLGRRKAFITGGYILWGLSTLAFGFIQVDGEAGAVKNAVALAVLAVITLDCIMSFLGSGANDAAFQAWVTDNTHPGNRGRVDGVIVIMPLVAMLIVFGGFDPLTQAGEWKTFFAIFGALVIAVGIASFWLLDDSASTKNTDTTFFAQVVHGLKPTTMRQRPELYSVLLTWLLWAISVQVFMPYLIIYIREFLNIEGYAIVLATVLTLASIASVIAGRFMDKIGKVTFLIPAGAIYGTGLLLMFLLQSFAGVLIAGTVMMSGFMFVNAALSALVRDASPTDNVGQTQGLRMICAVMLPSVIGPFIGAQAIRSSTGTYEELGVLKDVPTPMMFLAALIVAGLSFLPALWVRRTHKIRVTLMEHDTAQLASTSGTTSSANATSTTSTANTANTPSSTSTANESTNS